MPRIVSLIASATEIISALGFERDLVGRSHECDYPPSIQHLPILTAPKFDIHGTSREIDERVKATLQDATSVYRVDAEKLRELRPDLIVTQSQCEVCAVSTKDVEAAICSWVDSQPRVVALEPNCLEDVWDDIGRVARGLNAAERGNDLNQELQGRMMRIKTQSANLKRPTVACLEWLDPLMAAGNWVPELVALAGGTNLFGAAGKHSPWMTWEQLREHDPAVIVAMPCGFDVARTRTEMAAPVRLPGWNTLEAVRNERVFVTDGNQFFNRPGPRLVESLEILAEILHPEPFHFGHEGIGWERYAPSEPEALATVWS